MVKRQSSLYNTNNNMFTKIIVSFALVATIASAFELSPEAKEIITKCAADHNIKIEQVKEAVENKKLPVTQDGKCFLDCVMVGVGLLKDGQFDVNRAKELNALKLKDKPEIMEKANQVVDKCSQEVTNPGGECEYAVALMKCAAETGKELGIPAPEVP